MKGKGRFLKAPRLRFDYDEYKTLKTKKSREVIVRKVTEDEEKVEFTGLTTGGGWVIERKKDGMFESDEWIMTLEEREGGGCKAYIPLEKVYKYDLGAE